MERYVGDYSSNGWKLSNMIVCGTDVIFLGLNLRHHIFVMNSMLYIDLHYMHI